MAEVFDRLYNSYYEGLGSPWPRARRGIVSRPSLEEVLEFRSIVDASICLAYENKAVDTKLLEIGLHHEQQHQELLYYDLKSMLFHNGDPGPLELSFWPPNKLALNADNGTQTQRPHPNEKALRFTHEQIVTIGAAKDAFAYDNESPAHRVLLHPFRLEPELVRAKAYLDFIADGGYDQSTLWLSDGWHWRQTHDIQAPRYWRQTAQHGWQVYELTTGWRELYEHDLVTHVSYFEADAFARWSQKRLPTEFEWEAAVQNLLRSPDLQQDPGQLDPSWFRQSWQWTQSDYQAYPGYQSFAGVLQEYNGKFMSGQRVLRGGSVATPAGHSRPTYRNFFYPHQRWQLAGIRLAESL